MPNKTVPLNPNLRNLAEKIQHLSQEDRDTIFLQLSACRNFAHNAPNEWNNPKEDNFFDFNRDAAIFFITNKCIGHVLIEPNSTVVPVTDKRALQRDPLAKQQLTIIEGIDAFVSASIEEVVQFYETANKPLSLKTITRGHDPR